MYVDRLIMKEFRCFERAKVSFVYPDKKGLPEGVLDNVTLLMGINGTGKTSVLRATSLALLTPKLYELGYLPYYLARRVIETSERPDATAVQIDLAHDPNEWNPDAKSLLGYTFGISLNDGEDRFYHQVVLGQAKPRDAAIGFFLGYGATRRAEYLEHLDSQRSKRRHPGFQRVAGLFEDYITLYPLAAWYPTLESKVRQKEVRELLNGLLPEGTEFTGEFKDADALFKHNGVKLPFGALSDGFRSYIGLVADMLYHLNYVCPKKSKLTDLSGVVMIDDIDVHLHPKWQREVVPNLAKTFPKLQFIITSHSPLVAGTLHAANIRVIEDNQVHEYTERIHGLSADQILTSSYFGLESSRSPDAVAKLNHIAKRVADTHDPAPAIEFLEELAGKTNGKTKKRK